MGQQTIKDDVRLRPLGILRCPLLQPAEAPSPAPVFREKAQNYVDSINR